MSIPNVHGVGRVAALAAEAPAQAPSVRPSPAPPIGEIDQDTQQPVPPRFPWLSRLSQQLEAAARQRPAFAPAPALGDHVDKSV